MMQISYPDLLTLFSVTLGLASTLVGADWYDYSRSWSVLRCVDYVFRWEGIETRPPRRVENYNGNDCSFPAQAQDQYTCSSSTGWRCLFIQKTRVIEERVATDSLLPCTLILLIAPAFLELMVLCPCDGGRNSGFMNLRSSSPSIRAADWYAATA